MWHKKEYAPLKFLLTLSIIFFLTPHSLSAEKNGLYVSSLDGTQIKFSDLLKKNQWNIIFVWTTYCTHCDDQYQFLTNIHSSDKDITVIGLNLDGLNFSKKVFCSMVLLIDQLQHIFWRPANDSLII